MYEIREKQNNALLNVDKIIKKIINPEEKSFMDKVKDFFK